MNIIKFNKGKTGLVSDNDRWQKVEDEILEMPSKFDNLWKEYDSLNENSDELSESRKQALLLKIKNLDDRQKILLDEMNSGIVKVTKKDENNIIDF